MNAISNAAIVITYLRKRVRQSDRTAWVRWREICDALFRDIYQNADLTISINEAVAKGRKAGPDQLLEWSNNLNAEDKKVLNQLIQLYLDLEQDARDIVTHQRCLAALKSVGLDIELSAVDKAAVDGWLEQFKEDRFEQKIRIPGVIWIILFDFAARWLLLYLQQKEVLSDWGYQLMTISSDEGFFIICQALLLPIIVLTLAILRDKRVVKRAHELFQDLNRTDFKLEVHHSPWNYLVGFIVVIVGVLVPKLAFGWGSDSVTQIAMTLITVLYGSYILTILRQFSKKFPSGQLIAKQLDALNLKQVKSNLSAEENDEEIIELEVSLRSSNEKMEAYVLEAALFGALAFSAFLQIISSGSLGLDQIEAFTSGISEAISSTLKFEESDQSLLGIISDKSNLLSLMAYETLFCSSFFLAVIASRLRFNDLTDTIDRYLNLSESYNEKEETELNRNAEADPGRLNALTRKIRRFLSLGNLSLEETKPIMEYMRFFRTLGISTFFLILITGGLFISVNLSLILLFISVLSLMFFQLDAIKQRLKNLSTRLQEFYFTINKQVHIFSWAAIASSFFLRGFGFEVGTVIMVLAFLVLFLHYIMSLFVPERIALSGRDMDLFGSRKSLLILGGKTLKVALAIFFLGYMAKAMHWPGAGISLILGSFLLIFYFLVSKKSVDAPKWVEYVIGVALATGMLGIIFKLQRWPGSDSLRFIALLTILISAYLVYRFRAQMLPPTKRAVIIMMVVGLLAQFKYTSFMMSTLTFNTNAYEQVAQFDQLLTKLSSPIARGGFGDATEGPYLDSLYSTIETVDSIGNMSATFSSEEYNLLAWNAYLTFKDSLALERALKWAEVSVDRREMFANQDTYAHLLFVTGRLEKARASALRCLELAKQNGIDSDLKATRELLDDIDEAMINNDQDLD